MLFASMDWCFWPMMFLGVVIYFSQRAWNKVTPEQKEHAAKGLADFIARKFK